MFAMARMNPRPGTFCADYRWNKSHFILFQQTNRGVAITDRIFSHALSPHPSPAGNPFKCSHPRGATILAEGGGRSSRFKEPAALRARSGSIRNSQLLIGITTLGETNIRRSI